MNDRRHAILFSPARVQAVLAQMPTIAALIPAPAAEGVESEAFPDVLRKTDRELYRWIANLHYEQLLEPVLQLEEIHAAGCRFGHMLKTTSRQLFVSLSAEAFVAHDLLRRDFAVETIERAGGRSPDLRVRGDGVDMAVEVYRPRELLAVKEWTDAVGDLMQYVDVRASFYGRGSTDLERPVRPDPPQFDPWAHDRMLKQTRATVMAEISRDVADALGVLRPLEKRYPHPGTPMVTTITLDNVRGVRDAGPVRQASFSYPGFSGYSPTGVFRTVVDRAVKKAARRQTHTVDAETRALVVDLMDTQIAQDLVHPVYSEQAREVLGEVDPTKYGLDVIAFVVRALPRGLAYVVMVMDDERLTRAQVDALFGQRD